MSITISPTRPCDFSHDGYTVKINGQSVTPDAARVSAVPYNRRWPGHQRTLDQTECVNFLSFAMDEPVSLEITPKEPFENAVIRPHSLGITPEITEDGRILFPLPRPAYCTVEPASSDGKSYGRKNALHIGEHCENIRYIHA